MDKSQLRNLMISNRGFLKSFGTSSNFQARNLIRSATDEELKTLALILHKICIGQIPMSKSTLNELSKRKKVTYLRKKFESTEDLNQFLKESNSSQQKLLTPLSMTIKSLLHPVLYK